MCTPALPTTAHRNAVLSQAFDVTSELDGMYWGVLVSTMLFGVTISQVWTYANHNRDGWGLQSFVAVLILMDLVVTGLTWQVLRFYLMINFGNSQVLLMTTRPWATSEILATAISTVTDWYFASRIYLLDKKRSVWAPILVCLLVTAGFVCITVAIQESFVHPAVSQLATYYDHVLIGTGLGFTLCAVMFITAFLIIRLSSIRTGAKNLRTRSRIQKLVLFFVTRGLLVTVNQICFLAAYEAPALSLHWLPFSLLDPKLHIITLMAMLNSRQSMTSPQLDPRVATSFANDSGRAGPINLTALTKKSGTSSSCGTTIPPAMHISSLMDRAEGYGNALKGKRRFF